MKNIIFIAPPAAGKGTQSKLISAEYNIPHISTGDLLRDEIKSGSPLGKELQAVIGPGISLDAFEVGDEVYSEFAEASFDMAAICRREDKWHIDLKECNRQQLCASGIADINITVSPVCTYTDYADYFSARRLGTASGRIFTGIMLK